MAIDKVTWMNVQRRLKELGMLKGTVDGIAGPATLAALKGFQRINGLKPVDGIPGTKTMAALFPPSDIVDRVLTGEDPIPEKPEVDIDEDTIPIKPTTPGVTNTQKNNWPSQGYASMVKSFGPIGKNQTKIKLPFPMIIAWDRRKTIKSMVLHEKVADSATRCFNRIANEYSDAKKRRELGLDIWGGSLNVRKMRGGTSWSIHSWGCAIDFDPERNQLRWDSKRARLAKADCVKFWQIWEEEGWVSLGRVKDYDWMHIQSSKLN